MINIIPIAPNYCCLRTAEIPLWSVPINYLDHGSIAVKGIYLIVEIHSQFTVLVVGVGRDGVLNHRVQSHPIQIPIERSRTPRFPPLGII